MRSSALVSVIIPARDAERQLTRALDSAVAQSYRPMQVIVVDDGSEDATHHIACGYGPPVEVIRLPESVGPAAARNIGIGVADGAYVAFLDADDEWLPEKTSRQVAIMDADPTMSFVYCGAALVSDAPHAPALVNAQGPPARGADAWKSLLAYPSVSTPTVLARREVVLRAGLFDPDLPIAEDQDLWIRLARLGPVGYVDEVLARVHDTPGSLMKRRAREGVGYAWKVVNRHVKAAADALTAAEIRTIYAERSERLGRNAYEAGAVMQGMRLLLRSIRLGKPTLPILRHLFAASPVWSFIKRAFGKRRNFGRSVKSGRARRSEVNR